MPSPANPMKTPINGLSSAEARRRLDQVGPSATPDVAVHPLRLVLSKFLAPVSVLLETAIVLQLVLGAYVEASIIGVAQQLPARSEAPPVRSTSSRLGPSNGRRLAQPALAQLPFWHTPHAR